MLDALWAEVKTLHAAGITHGELDPLRIVVSDGHVALDDFSEADATTQQFWMDQDVAAALVATALRVGNERAIAAAVRALGKERVGEVLPVVQPAAVPAATTTGVKHLNKALKALRDEARDGHRHRGGEAAPDPSAHLGEHRDPRRCAPRARRSRSRASRASTGRRSRASSRTRTGAG